MFYKIVFNKVKTLGHSCRGTPTAIISIRTFIISGLKRNKLNHVGAILDVRIIIRITSSLNSVRIKWLCEPFYPNADDIQTSSGKING